MGYFGKHAFEVVHVRALVVAKQRPALLHDALPLAQPPESLREQEAPVLIVLTQPLALMLSDVQALPSSQSDTFALPVHKPDAMLQRSGSPDLLLQPATPWEVKHPVQSALPHGSTRCSVQV